MKLMHKWPLSEAIPIAKSLQLRELQYMSMESETRWTVVIRTRLCLRGWSVDCRIYRPKGPVDHKIVDFLSCYLLS